jgi:glycine/D-amino acid oxidase-like deaminating enzyme
MATLPRLLRRFAHNRRFWRLVQAGEPRECWPWQGAVDDEGYGRFRGQRADDYAYALARGARAGGSHVEHECGNPRCVNPNHLAAPSGSG